MQRSSVAVSWMFYLDVWVAQKDFDLIYLTQPASLCQRISLEARLLIRIQSKAEEIFESLYRAHAGGNVDWTPLVLDRGMREACPFLD